MPLPRRPRRRNYRRTVQVLGVLFAACTVFFAGRSHGIASVPVIPWIDFIYPHHALEAADDFRLNCVPEGYRYVEAHVDPTNGKILLIELERIE